MQFQKLPAIFVGTGDLFAACLLAWLEKESGLKVRNRYSVSTCTDILSVHVPVLCQYMYRYSDSTCTGTLSVHVPVLCQYMYRYSVSICTGTLSVHVPVLCQYMYRYSVST